LLNKSQPDLHLVPMTLFLQICDGRQQPVDPLDNEIDRLRHDGDPVAFNEGVKA
jgi:hypothetical protein